MSADAVFVKTQAGQMELDQRRRNLGMAARRLLILINGNRAREELRPLVGSRVDLDVELSKLLLEGLIEAVSGRATISKPEAPVEAPKRGLLGRLFAFAESKPRLEPAAHARMREACLLLHDVLGPEADDLVMKVEESNSPEELERNLVRSLSVVATVRGKHEAEALRLAMALPEDALP